MIRGRVIAFAALALGGLVALVFYLRQSRDQSPVSSRISPRVETPASFAPATTPPGPSRIAMQVPERDELADVPTNPMAGAIGSDNISPEKEIALVLDLFQIYRREFRAFPAGQSNAHFMNALRGANPGRLPIFPLLHPRLDPAGNLLDRWQKPYQFHPVSRDRLEIRSSGPDREIFTPDDLVIPR